MKCKRAKQEMALCAGRDLDAATEQELQRHLANCPRCYDQWNRIRAATSILHQAGLEEAEVPSPQLWSSVSGSIQAAPSRQSARGESFSLSNAVVPIVAVASLVLAVFSINQSLNNPPPSQGRLITETAYPPHGEMGTTVTHPFSSVRQPILKDASSPVEPPSSPMERILRDRETYRRTPTPQEPLRDKLPGGNYRPSE